MPELSKLLLSATGGILSSSMAVMLSPAAAPLNDSGEELQQRSACPLIAGTRRHLTTCSGPAEKHFVSVAACTQTPTSSRSRRPHRRTWKTCSVSRAARYVVSRVAPMPTESRRAVLRARRVMSERVRGDRARDLSQVPLDRKRPASALLHASQRVCLRRLLSIWQRKKVTVLARTHAAVGAQKGSHYNDAYKNRRHRHKRHRQTYSVMGHCRQQPRVVHGGDVRLASVRPS